MRTLWLPSLAAVLTLLPGVALGAPLTLNDVNALATYVDCQDRCRSGAAADYQVCLLGCGTPDPAWDKDGVEGITRQDLVLAQLERTAATEFCYRDNGRMVVPAPLCGDPLCRTVPVCGDSQCNASPRPTACPDVVCAARPARTAADCADGDGDGIPAWLEAATRGSDTSREAFCSANQACDFVTQCTYDTSLGASRCLPRTCPNNQCTVFHLETVAADDQQVLIHVVFDYSPVPALALEMHVQFDRNVLLFADARPLPNLTEFNKQLYSSLTSSGLVRLVMWDPNGAPILPGPLVELVFQRVGDGATTVGFATADALQEDAISPRQGSEAQQLGLRNDALWGTPVTIPARADRDGGFPEAADSNLLLWYDFDDADNPVALRHVPSAEDLCQRLPGCANEPDPVEKARVLARLARLQLGSMKSSASAQGVSRGAMVLNGETDHVRLPVHVLEPLDPSGQSFSVSTWVYSEGFTAAETAPQVVFSHLAADERTRFGLVLKKEPGGSSSLHFFTGDILATTPITTAAVGTAFPDRTWQHVALTLDAATGLVSLYFNGALARTANLPLAPAPVACPTFIRGGDLSIHQDGDFTGGNIPEVLYYAPKRGPLFQVERMDLRGLASQAVLADGVHNFQDVDYLPTLNKIVFASDSNGSMEIYVADGDGSHAQQVTLGFGDAARNLEARRPRWAPDGSGVVFESNVYSVTASHNTGAGNQLYYVAFDAQAGQVAIPLEDGSTATQLDYEALTASQSLPAFQLTSGNNHSTNAFFLSGKPQAGTTRGELVYQQTDLQTRGAQVRRLTIPANIRETSTARVDGLRQGPQACTKPLDGEQGVLQCPAGTTITSVDQALFGYNVLGTCADPAYTASSPPNAQCRTDDFRARVETLCLGKQVCDLAPIGLPDACPNYRKHRAVRVSCSWPEGTEEHLLTAGTRRTGVGTAAANTPFLVYTRRALGQPLQPNTQFTTSVTASTNQEQLTITHSPSGYSATCWDTNHNGTADAATEDTNRDGTVNVNDCYPVEAFLFVRYDDTLFTPRVNPADIATARQGTVLAPAGATAATTKDLNLAVTDVNGVKYLRVEMLSPRNSLPLPAGVVAKVVFQDNDGQANSRAGTYSLFTRAALAPWDLEVQRLDTTPPPRPVTVSLLATGAGASVPALEEVSGAALSPDGTRLLLAGISRSRPVLVRTASLSSLSGATRVGEFTAPVRGLAWLREPAFFPCNWVGGVLHPLADTLVRPMRGALDDFKVHAGVRDPDSIRSESAVGHERLVAEGRAGAGAPRQSTCAVHTDCPEFQLCRSGACAVVPCDPTTPGTCEALNARCTLRPDSVRQGDFDSPAPSAWVCAVDCVADTECFSQSCLNGPCRYCQGGQSACVECRYAEQSYGSYIIRGTEGCPDRNSFSCEDGNCRTECYTIQDGQSTYRCDRALEYCKAGRCEALRWDWGDVAPATLQGLSETRYTSVPGVVRTVAVGEATTVQFKAYGKGDYARAPEVLVEAKLVAADGASYYGGEWFRVGRIMVDNPTALHADAKPYVLNVPHPISALRMRLVHTPYENLQAAATGLGAKDKDFCVDDVAQAAGRNAPSSARCVHRPPGSAQHLGYSANIPYEEAVKACMRTGVGCPSVQDGLRNYLGDGVPGVIVKEVTVNGASATIQDNPVCSWKDTLQPLDPASQKRRKLYYGDITTELSPTKRAECGERRAVTSPPVTSGLAAHYSARSDASVVRGTTNAVTQWKDLSGNGRHLNADRSNPVYNATLFGAVPGLDFSGNIRMSTAGFPITQEVTVFAVIQHRDPSTWGGIIHHGSRDYDWSLQQSGFDWSTNRNIYHFKSQNDNVGAELTLARDGRYVLAGRISGTTRSFWATPLGGTTVSTSATGVSISLGSKQLYVGATEATSDESFRGYVGELIYYNRALTDAEVTAVQAYLDQQWKPLSSTCSTTSTLKDFKAVSNGAYGLLNCNYNDSATQLAAVNFTLPPIRQRWQSGAVKENANLCWVELDQVRREQCYEYIGGDASLDPESAPADVFQLLDVTLPRGFAHDQGFTSTAQNAAALQVAVTGLPAGESVRVRNGTESLLINGTANGTVTANFPTVLRVGRTYAVSIVAQPPAIRGSVVSAAGAATAYLCWLGASSAGAMVAAGATVQLTCGRAAMAFLNVAGQTGGNVTAELAAAWSAPLLAVGQANTWVLASQDLEANRRYYRTNAGLFPALIPVGQEVRPTVVDQPAAPPQVCTRWTPAVYAMGTSPNGDNIGFMVGVNCTAQTGRTLGGQVAGLVANGLVLKNLSTSESITVPPPSGTGALASFTFTSRIPPGQPYLVTVATQPVNQTCVVANAGGTMPDANVTNVRVDCTSTPTWPVSFEVAGLQGQGLQVSLNASQVVNVPTDGTYAFPGRLLEGAAYSVTVTRQPVTPDQDCQVVQGDGRAAAPADGGLAGTPRVICELRGGTNNTYTVGGSVYGLLGRGLRLGLGYTAKPAPYPDGGRPADPNPMQTLDISKNGKFTFRTAVANNTLTLATVVMQPASPDQVCSVTAGEEGRVLDGNITNVVVRCSNSSEVRLTLDWAGAPLASGRAARFTLFDGNGVARARSTASQLDGPGNQVLSLLDPLAAGSDIPPAAVPPGTYTLWGFVNSNNSVDGSGAATFDAGDLGVTRTVTVTNTAFTDVTVVMNSGAAGYAWAATTSEPVFVLAAADVATDAAVTCYWLPKTGVRPALPLAGYVGSSTVSCRADLVPCMRFISGPSPRGATTDANGPLLSSTAAGNNYDVMCWMDRGGTNGAPDNILNAGDRVGWATNVTVDGPGAATSRTEITLSQP